MCWAPCSHLGVISRFLRATLVSAKKKDKGRKPSLLQNGPQEEFWTSWAGPPAGMVTLIRVQRFEICFPSPEMKAFAFSIKLLKTEALKHRSSSLLCTHRPAATEMQALTSPFTCHGEPLAPRHLLVGYRLQPRSPLCWAFRLAFTNIHAS